MKLLKKVIIVNQHSYHCQYCFEIALVIYSYSLLSCLFESNNDGFLFKWMFNLKHITLSLRHVKATEYSENSLRRKRKGQEKIRDRFLLVICQYMEYKLVRSQYLQSKRCEVGKGHAF